VTPVIYIITVHFHFSLTPLYQSSLSLVRYVGKLIAATGVVFRIQIGQQLGEPADIAGIERQTDQSIEFVLI
jgi:hypothetical protein